MRTKGEPGTGNIVEAVRHMRHINDQIRRVVNSDDAELMTMARDMGAPFELLRIVKAEGKLPVPNFAAGGIATPADVFLYNTSAHFVRRHETRVGKTTLSKRSAGG